MGQGKEEDFENNVLRQGRQNTWQQEGTFEVLKRRFFTWKEFTEEYRTGLGVKGT